MKYYNICYGDKSLNLTLPCNFNINYYKSYSDLNEDFNLDDSLKNGLYENTLHNLVKNALNIVIIIDDNTRPTPSNRILPILIKEIETITTKKAKIKIIVALGAHKKLTKSELISLVGEEVFNSYPVINHEAEDSEHLLNLGLTKSGTPVFMSKIVVEADLRILLGMIKPHNQAGYTGGGKALLPGVCSVNTIHANHSFKYMDSSYSRVGILSNNPIRNDINDVLPLIGPCILINLIMDRLKNIVDLVIGENVVEEHKKGAAKYNKIGKFLVKDLADICLCGTPNPIDINFYQMLNALSAPHRQAFPIIKTRGTILVFGRAVEGISDGDMYYALSNFSRKELREQVFTNNSELKDRPALQIFLEVEQLYKIIILTENKNISKFRDMKIEAYSITDFNQIIVKLSLKYGSKPNCSILSDAPYLIFDFNKTQEEECYV